MAIYPTAEVTAVFSEPDGSYASNRRVQLELRPGGYVWMKGGPTGWESFDPTGWPTGRDWVANMGDRRYLHCVVPAAELDRALPELGIRSQSLATPESRL